MSADFEVVTVEPTAAHTHTAIFLHSRDSILTEFVPEFFAGESSKPKRTLLQLFPGIKWVFPAAKTIPSAIFGPIPQWFDMQMTEEPHKGEEGQQEELERTISGILRIIDTEAAMVGGVEKILLGGMSQGCASAIHTLAAQQKRLAGFVGLSSWLPLRDVMGKAIRAGSGSASINSTSRFVSTQAIKTPIFLAHCRNDETIEIKYGHELRDGLVQMGFAVEWKEYEDGKHWINEPNGIDDIAAFLKKTMGRRSTGEIWNMSDI